MNTKVVLLLIVSNLLTVFLQEIIEDNQLLTLGETNFNEIYQSKKTLLVAFIIPSCQRCFELQAKLSIVAKQLKLSHHSDIAVAKVDVTAEATLAARYGISSAASAEAGDFPKLKLFSHARPGPPVDFTGRRVDTAEEITASLLSAGEESPQSGALYRLTDANLTQAMARQASWLVGVLNLTADQAGGGADDVLEVLREVAEELRGDRQESTIAVGYVDAGDEAAMAARLRVPMDTLPAFVVLWQGEDWAIPFSHPPTVANLAKFYRAHGSESASGIRSEAGRVFASLEAVNSIGEGLDALLVASSAARPEVRRFLAAFLAESGFFYERRLEGGLVSADAGLAERLGVTCPDSVYVRLAPKLLTEGEPTLARYPGPLNSSPALKGFFDRRSLPRLGLLAWNTRRAYMSAGRPLCIFYASLSGGWRGQAGRLARETHARLARLLAGRHGDALFAMADETQEEDEVARFGFDESSAGVNLGCYDASRRRFAMPESDGPDPEDVRRFLDAVEAGVAPQRIRSATVPMTTGRVTEVNADRLDRLQLAGDGAAVLLIQCDFDNQPCGHSLVEFAAAASAAASLPLLGNVRFARLNTRYNDAPGELYYRYEGDVDMAAAQPQVLLLPPRGVAGGHQQLGSPIRYERDVVARDYLLQFLSDRLQPSVAPSAASTADKSAGRVEL